MFDSLLSGKFSKKCKHCIKCINSRLLLIKKKKQATVKFLKKDVADLLANGHDSNAFGRIEAILVEINRVYCYEMIENYCQCILNILPSLQKLRECPEETKEAISTLIFAAARFSDLPELYDLRQIFTERYGGQMESSVNAQFIEKVQKKSFTTDTKLQLMRSIADDFSLTWDPNAFQQKLANPTQISLDKASISKNSYNRRPSNLDSNVWNEAMNPHLHKSVSDAAVETHISYNRTETVFNPDITFTRRKETMSNSLDSSFSSKKEKVYSVMDKSQKQQVHPEPKDIHEIPANNNGKLHDHSRNGDDVASFYVKPTWVQNRTRKNEGLASNMSPIRQEGPGLISIEKEVDTTPYTILKGIRNGGGHVDNAPMYDDFTKVEKAKNPIYDEFIKVEKDKKLPKPKYDEFLPREGKTHMYDYFTNKDMAEKPTYDEIGKVEKDRKLPYNSLLKTNQERKPKYDEFLPRDEKTHLYDDFSKMEKAKNPKYDEFMKAEKEKRYDASLFEKSSRNTTPRPLSMIPPPYTKSNVKDTPNYIPKPPANVDKIGTLERQENEVRHGRKKHHEGRRRHEMYDGDCDEEDEIMDRLLKHLSKKGYEEESSRRSGARAPHAERVSSLPNESVSPVVVDGGRCRASSMQADVEVSDYDDLAARFQALKRN